MVVQGPCIVAENGMVPNPNRWTENFNLIALDHPVGVGASYGTQVNNSRSTAIDVYDFLQKFFHLFPHLVHLFYRGNIAFVAGKGQPGAVHIDLESRMVSNPISDATSHFAWLLQTRCYDVPDMYNASTCAEMVEILPTRLESIQFVQQTPEWSVERRVAAQDICQKLQLGDTHDTVVEDVRKKAVLLQRAQVSEIWRHNSIIILDVWTASHGRNSSLALCRSGGCQLRLTWSNFILLQSPFQDEFLRARDVPWPSAEDATVRVVGDGAGNMTYILVAQGGHFVARDQPALVESIIDHWVENVPFVFA
ncbi:SET domain-containing protein [Mycena venus]|uniref:SET domain-containing protein n=1 Tax=Mycena venus TaxID=2733690 RepID=A0A8H6YTA2_9AGAR|nr:SET domain-containing protein [Mycena venus]